jgi:hypothetical protein
MGHYRFMFRCIRNEPGAPDLFAGTGNQSSALRPELPSAAVRRYALPSDLAAALRFLIAEELTRLSAALPKRFAAVKSKGKYPKLRKCRAHCQRRKPSHHGRRWLRPNNASRRSPHSQPPANHQTSESRNGQIGEVFRGVQVYWKISLGVFGEIAA